MPRRTNSLQAVRKPVSVGLVSFCALACVMTLATIPAQGYVPSPPYLGCFNSSEADLLSLERSLSPAVNMYVQAGTPVTFSGYSGTSVTFAVASSAELLSSPDIDSGLGTLQPGTSSYAFTSTKATVTPGTLVYWDASFSNATLTACEGMAPNTYTTAVRMFAVVSPPSIAAEAAAKKKQEEEVAANKKKEEEAALGTSSVSLADTVIAVQGGSLSLVNLECLGSASCNGKLTLSAKIASKVKKKPGRTVRIGTASYSIQGDETKTVQVHLDAAGRALLNADHGRLSATLTVLKSSPAPSQTHNESVHLVQQKAHGKAKK